MIMNRIIPAQNKKRGLGGGCCVKFYNFETFFLTFWIKVKKMQVNSKMLPVYLASISLFKPELQYLLIKGQQNRITP